MFGHVAGEKGHEGDGGAIGATLLDDKYMEDLMNGKDDGLWDLQDDLMLEEPP